MLKTLDIPEQNRPESETFRRLRNELACKPLKRLEIPARFRDDVPAVPVGIVCIWVRLTDSD